MLSSLRIVPSVLVALLVTLFACASLSACGDDSGSTPTDGSAGDGSTGDGGGLGGPGDSCVTAANCQAGLDCVMGVCTATTNGAIGDPCIYTAQCMDGLYCSIPRSCQSEGTGVMLAACTDSGDCEAPLVCEPQVTGASRCVSAGSGDIGSPGDGCSTVADCQAGLFCIDGECRGQQGGTGSDAGVDGGVDLDASVDTAVGPLCDDVTDCDDGSECTIDQCVGLNCRNTLVDGDEDGYASTLIAGGCGRDCNDMNDSVNPDHTGFETVRHTNPLPTVRDTFDWNCDGTEEMQYTSFVPECDDSGDGSCSSGEGWTGGELPECGTSRTWARCNVGASGFSCSLETVETRTQACR